MKVSPDNIRLRKIKRENSNLLLNLDSDNDVRCRRISLPNHLAYGVMLAGMLSLKCFSLFNNYLPTQVTLHDEYIQPKRFIGQRAESFLKRLTDIGTRVVGSYENEVLAVDLLQREISFIIQQSEKIHKIEVDIQKPTGSYNLYLKPYNFRNYYANIQNIVVRFSSNNSSFDSILINCHYDTVPESPGASDNGLNCAVMLEVLTKLSKSKESLYNTIIFLFNGAEENPLQASHGFISQHKWSKDVKVVINLDSGGAGGKEILFQTTSTFPWLVKSYAKAVPHPSGGVHAEELFLSGIVPSDTDFRIFRDFGNVPGLDLAHIENGYVYHTKFDNMDFVPPGVIQHTGDNILALAKELASSPDLGRMYKPEINPEWKVVYFDVFGIYMVVYNELYAIILNTGTAVLSFYSVYRSFKYLSGNSKPWKRMIISGVSQLLSWLFISGVLILISKILDTFNATLSWYAHPWYILPIYFVPLVFSSALVPILSHRIEGRKPEAMVIQCINGNQVLWAIILLVGTYIRIRCSYLIMLVLLTSAACSSIITYSSSTFSERRYIIVNAVSTIVPVFFFLHLAVRTFTTLIPMTGRMGPQVQSEMVIAGLVIIFGILTTSYVTPLILVLQKPKSFLRNLIVLHLLALFIVLATPLGFPYSGDASQPAFQRFYVLHCERTFHDNKGNIRKSDSGFFVQSFDRNNINYVLKVIPQLQHARSASTECLSELNCGVPVFTSRFLNPAPFGFWVSSHPPLIHHPTSLEVMSQTPLDIRTRRIRFNVSGPDHITIFLSPGTGVTLKSWSFDEFPPKKGAKWGDRDTYMVYYSHGLMGGILEFSLDLEIDNITVSDSVLDIAVIGHYMHDKNFRSQEFSRFISRFPNWAHVAPWTATYKSWDESLNAMKNLRHLYHQIYVLSLNVNNVFSTRNLIIIGYNFFKGTILIYCGINGVVKYMNKKPSTTIIEIINYFKWSSVCFTSIYGLIWASNFVCSEAGTTSVLIQEFFTRVPKGDLQLELRSFIIQLFHEKICFSPHGFFLINNRLLLSLLNIRSADTFDVGRYVHFVSNVVVILEVFLTLISAGRCSEIRRKFSCLEKNFGFDEKVELKDYLFLPVINLIFVSLTDVAQCVLICKGKSFTEMFPIISGLAFEVGNVMHVMQFSIYLSRLRRLSRVLNNAARELIAMGGSRCCDELLPSFVMVGKFDGSQRREADEVHPPFFSSKNKMQSFRILNMDEKYERVKICRFLYNEMFKLSLDIDEAFATRNVINVAYNFAVAFAFINPALSAAVEYFGIKAVIESDNDEISVEQIIFRCKWTLICFISIYSMIWSCELTLTESCTIYPLLYEVSAIPLNENLQVEINSFAFQVVRQQIQFSPHDIFTLNNSLFLSILAKFASYLMILIQFEIQA